MIPIQRFPGITGVCYIYIIIYIYECYRNGTNVQMYDFWVFSHVGTNYDNCRARNHKNINYPSRVQ